MCAVAGTLALATLTAGLGGAAPASAATVRLGLGIDLSLDGSLRLGLDLDARVGFDQSNWNGDNTGEQNPMWKVTTTTGAQTVWARNDSAGRKITGKGIGVAVIDSGIAPVTGLNSTGKVVNGPDLSFESQAANLRHLDTYGHGTHLAGIIAGQDPTQSGQPTASTFTGMAPDATLLNVKAASADGATDVSQVIAAIDWVVAHRDDPGLNIRVINLAFGTDSLQDPRLDPLSHAVEAAWRKGIVVVVAVGNDGPTATRVTMPAANPYVIAVGASDGLNTPNKADDVVASFSTKGNLFRHADLLAPGRSIVSLRSPGSFIDTMYPSGRVPGDAEERYFRGSGTSQATAVVSGAAALLLQQRPNLTPDQVKSLLMGSATPMPAADLIGRGAGQLNVAAAANALTPIARQLHPASIGTGSLDRSRGSARVADPDTGTELSGEKDIMGQAWMPATWAPASTAGTAWTGGTWNGRVWSGAAWTGTSWTARTWSGAGWTGANWAGRTWSSQTWSSAAWTGRTWSGRTWSGRTWSGAIWSD
jgi:serine protease AprX